MRKRKKINSANFQFIQLYSLANQTTTKNFFFLFSIMLFLCHVLLHTHLLNSIVEGLVIILPSNNLVCLQKAFTRILLPIILGTGHVQTAGRKEKTENSLCVIIMHPWNRFLPLPLEAIKLKQICFCHCVPSQMHTWSYTGKHMIKKERQHWAASFPYTR